MDKAWGWPPRMSLCFWLNDHIARLDPEYFILLGESKWNWLKRKMKSRDAGVKNSILTPERENNRRILGVGLKFKQTSGGSGEGRGDDGLS
ncbi:hypothetical protein Tco_0409328 [Tanacetum coccineum]